MRRGWTIVFLLLAVMACGAREKPFAPFALPKVKNVALISIDTLRADHVGVYGYKKKTTPNIDRLAAQSLRFAQAYSSSNWTLPAHAGMMTGLMSTGHGAIERQDAIRAEAPVLAERLSAAGLATAAFTSHVYVSDRFGFERGFQTFDYKQSAPGNEVTDKALRWLDGPRGGKNFFLFLHYFDVHLPYGKPYAPVKRFVSSPECRGPIQWGTLAAAAVAREWDRLPCFQELYDADIAFVDEQVGRVIDHLKQAGVFDDTLIIVTSDHGELFGEHNGAGHGLTMFDPEIRVPLIVRFPRGAGGPAVVSSLVSTIQLAPTIMEALGLPPFATDLPGLSALLTGRGKGLAWLAAESNKTGQDEIAVIDQRFKAVLPPTHELQGVSISPALFDRAGNEDRNEWNERPDEARRLFMLAANSGWYGRGVGYEVEFVPGPRRGSLEMMVEFPAGTEPYGLATTHMWFANRGGKVMPNRLTVKREQNRALIRLESGETRGYSVVMEQPGTPVTFRLPSQPGSSRIKMFVGGMDREAPGGATTLEGPTRAGPSPTSTHFGFVLLRGFEVLYLHRPGAGAATPSRQLSPEQINALRQLGYLGR